MRLEKRISGERPQAPCKISLIIPCILCALILSMGLAATASAVEVTVIADGQEWEWTSSHTTVGSILKDAGVTLGPKDRVEPCLGAKAEQNSRIRVFRIVEKVVVQKEPINYQTTIKFNPQASMRQVTREGERGEKEIKYLVTYKDGKKVDTKVLSATVLKKPVDEIVVVSKPTQLPSRGGYARRTIQMVATAYDPGPRSCGKWANGRTAIGMKAGYGVVAVDPRVIPLRTKLYVEGYGPCVAGDVGRAIKGNRIDLGFDTYSQAIKFGRRKVTVHILD